MNSSVNEPVPMGIHAWIGIDVSQDTLDVALEQLNRRKPAHRSFANKPEGWAKMMNWLKHLLGQAPNRDTCHFCLEATGTYSLPVATFLAEAEQRVSLLNPRRISDYAKYQNHSNKTDKADAALLADFCRKEQPDLWVAALPEVRELQALVRRLDAVKDLLQQEKCRLSAPALSASVRHSIESTITFLKQEIARLEQQIREHCDRNDGLKRQVELLQSIPGVGATTAYQVLSELPDVTRFSSAQQVAAYAGLAPCKSESGTSLKKSKLNKAGNARLRRALYMPSLSAKVYNPPVKALYDRLYEKHKTAKKALTAAMRKLLMLCYGVLKSGQPFQADWALEAATR
jgi:transposase